jgi:hypothetical protein
LMIPSSSPGQLADDIADRIAIACLNRCKRLFAPRFRFA